MDYIGVNVLKNIICKPIGNYLTNKYNIIDFPIIGRFKRPEGALNCGCFYISENNYSTSEGMPSGHSIDEYNIKNKKTIYFNNSLMFCFIYNVF